MLLIPPTLLMGIPPTRSMGTVRVAWLRGLAAATTEQRGLVELHGCRLWMLRTHDKDLETGSLQHLTGDLDGGRRLVEDWVSSVDVTYT